MKPCRGCGEHLPLDAFYKDSRNADGRRGRCIACVTAEGRARYKREKEEDPEAHRQRWATWARKHRERKGWRYGGFAYVLAEDPCAYCGAVGGTIDHIQPVSRGGANSETNFTGACSSCNSAKGNLSLLGFLLRRELLPQIDKLSTEAKWCTEL